MKKHFKFRLLCLPLVLCLCLTLITAFWTGERKQLTVHYNNGSVSLISGIDLTARDENDALFVLSSLDQYGYDDAKNEFVFSKTVDTAFGKVFRFNQVYKGVPVYGRGLNVSTGKNGSVLSVSGNYQAVCLNTVPALTFKEAADKASFYDYYDESLTIYSLEGETVLTYCFISVVDDMASRVFVDANTGGVTAVLSLTSNHLPLRGYDTTVVRNTKQTGVGDTDLTMDLERDYREHYLSDATRNIIVLNFNGSTQQTIPQTMFSQNVPAVDSPDYIFDDQIAVSALYNTVKSFDFYTDENNIGVSTRGVDNSVANTHVTGELQAFVLVGVHYGVNSQSAFSSFSNSFHHLYGRYSLLGFGDGAESGLYKPSGALDIVGHEYQHNMTKYLSNMENIRAAGALNEAYSDMFGALIEDKDIKTDAFWTIGEDASVSGTGTRSMSNPLSLGNPDHMNKAYSFSGAYDDGGVHYNSTIVTHAQYKMYTKAPNFFTKDVIGTLWYSALPTLSATSDFTDFRIALIAAAHNLEYSPDIIDIMKQSFDSVGIYGESGAHSVTFITDGLDGATPDPINREYKAAFTMPNTGLTSQHGTIVGWSISGDFSTTVYREGVSYSMPAHHLNLLPVIDRYIWNDITPAALNGQGTAASPYLISSAEELATVAYYINNNVTKPWTGKPHFLMTDNIDLRNIPWLPIGSATGTPTPVNGIDTVFDGGGYSIRNMMIYYANPVRFPYQGLFGGVKEFVIKNLTVESGLIETNTQFAGGIAGVVAGTDIINCRNFIDVTNNMTELTAGGFSTLGGAGGIVGYAEGGASQGGASTLTSCVNSGVISASFAGGIVSRTQYSVSHNFNINKGVIYGRTVSGGIVGITEGVLNVKNSLNSGAVQGANGISGGICGSLMTTANSTHNISGVSAGVVFGNGSLGLLIGSVSNRCTLNLNGAYFSGAGSAVGGIAEDSTWVKHNGDFERLTSADLTADVFSSLSNIPHDDRVSLYSLFSGADVYTITWSVNGQTTDELWAQGMLPKYSGEPYSDDGDAIMGWTPSVARVGGNALYTAVFVEIADAYTVTFWFDDGYIVFDRYTVPSGHTIIGAVSDINGYTLSSLPTLENYKRDGVTYEFKGWKMVTWAGTDSQMFTESTVIESTVDLYAHFEPQEKGCGCGVISIPALPSVLGLIVVFAAVIPLIVIKRKRSEG